MLTTGGWVFMLTYFALLLLGAGWCFSIVLRTRKPDERERDPGER